MTDKEKFQKAGDLIINKVKARKPGGSVRAVLTEILIESIPPEGQKDRSDMSIDLMGIQEE